jgi:hypothetical protein
MLVKLKLQGSGVSKDSYRVNLPTYQFIHGNISQGYAIIAVPDEVLGLSEDDLANESSEETTEGRLITSLSATNLDKLHAHLDKTYAEHKGKFRVENA